MEVGENKVLFTVHQHILAKSSEFFRRTAGNGFKESVDKHVCLPEQDPTLFNIYVNWLYANSLPTNLGKEADFGEVEFDDEGDDESVSEYLAAQRAMSIPDDPKQILIARFTSREYPALHPALSQIVDLCGRHTRYSLS